MKDKELREALRKDGVIGFFESAPYWIGDKNCLALIHHERELLHALGDYLGVEFYYTDPVPMQPAKLSVRKKVKR